MAGGAAPPIARPAWQTQFANVVSQGTGLRWDVVIGWIAAEGGPRDNPLNIGPGRHYGTTAAAAAATVKLLHNPRYANVVKTARTHPNDPTAQLNAIASSPWDAGHYGGNGKNLRGAYFTRFPHAGSFDPTFGAAGAVAGAAGDVAGALNPANWIGGVESWLEGAALRALAYVVLTVAAIALFVLGLERTLGPTPFTRAMPYNPRIAPIPF